MKMISKMPEVKETDNCSKHGEYEYRYLKSFANKIMVSDFCPACAKEKSIADELATKKAKAEDEKRSDAEFKIRRGISKRNVDVTFDDFNQQLPNQKRAVKVMHKLGKDVFDGVETPSVIMTGGVGTGKTMLASAMLNRLGWRRSYKIIKLIDLIRELKETWSRDAQATERGIIEFYSNLDLLVIDEIGMQFGSDTEKMFIFDVIDGRYEALKPTVIISNLQIKSTPDQPASVESIIGDRAIDRLRDGGGQLLTFDWGSARK